MPKPVTFVNDLVGLSCEDASGVELLMASMTVPLHGSFAETPPMVRMREEASTREAWAEEASENSARGGIENGKTPDSGLAASAGSGPVRVGDEPAARPSVAEEPPSQDSHDLSARPRARAGGASGTGELAKGNAPGASPDGEGRKSDEAAKLALRAAAEPVLPRSRGVSVHGEILADQAGAKPETGRAKPEIMLAVKAPAAFKSMAGGIALAERRAVGAGSTDHVAASTGADEGGKGAGTMDVNVSLGNAGRTAGGDLPSPLQSPNAAAAVSKSAAEGPFAAGGAASASAKTPVQSIGEQMMDSIHATLARGEQRVVVRLEPPELGTVVVRFQQRGDELQGTLEVAKTDIRHQIEQALPQVLRGLEEAGVHVRRLDVGLADQAGRDASREQPAQDDAPQQQDADRSSGHAPHSPSRRWSGQDGAVDGEFSFESREVAIEPAEERIDMLM